MGFAGQTCLWCRRPYFSKLLSGAEPAFTNRIPPRIAILTGTPYWCAVQSTKWRSERFRPLLAVVTIGEKPERV